MARNVDKRGLEDDGTSWIAQAQADYQLLSRTQAPRLERTSSGDGCGRRSRRRPRSCARADKGTAGDSTCATPEGEQDSSLAIGVLGRLGAE